MQTIFIKMWTIFVVVNIFENTNNLKNSKSFKNAINSLKFWIFSETVSLSQNTDNFFDSYVTSKYDIIPRIVSCLFDKKITIADECAWASPSALGCGPQVVFLVAQVAHIADDSSQVAKQHNSHTIIQAR